MAKVDVDVIDRAFGCSQFVEDCQVLVDLPDVLEEFQVLLREYSYVGMGHITILRICSFALRLLLLVKAYDFVDYQLKSLLQETVVKDVVH